MILSSLIRPPEKTPTKLNFMGSWYKKRRMDLKQIFQRNKILGILVLDNYSWQPGTHGLNQSL